MKVTAITSHIITKNDVLEDILNTYFPSVLEGSVVAISTKIISILEDRGVDKESASKDALIASEADTILFKDTTNPDITITLKDGRILPNAGIDESNTTSSYLLYPKDPWESCIAIWKYLSLKHNTTHFGVILTDSTTRMLRKGSTGVALAYCGVKALYSYTGNYDVFGKPLLVTNMQVVDALAASAVLSMGEGNEQTPFALIESPPHVIFTNKPPSAEEKKSGYVSLEDDIFSSLIQKNISQ